MPPQKYCCERFKESVNEGQFCHASNLDETEWFIPEWLHIYYCPFCGTKIKGRGTGIFHLQKHFNKEKKQKRRK